MSFATAGGSRPLRDDLIAFHQGVVRTHANNQHGICPLCGYPRCAEFAWSRAQLIAAGALQVADDQPVTGDGPDPLTTV